MSKIKKNKTTENSKKKPTKETKPKKEAPKSKVVEAKVNPVVLKAINTLNKRFGDNCSTTASNMQGFTENGINRIPTGSIDLDIKLGGGIPIGRVTHVSGAFSSSKSTQAMHIVKEAQKMGLTCAVADFEGTITVPYLKQIGVDTNNLVYMKPVSLEECTDALLALQQSGINLLVWDSVAVAEAVKVLDSKMDETVQMGTKQKLIGEFLAKFQSLNNGLSRNGETPCTLILINQLREKIGAYGDPEYEPGGKAIGFYTSVHIRVRRGDFIYEGKGDNKRVVAQEVKYKVLKNKTYKRMQSGEFDWYQDENNTAGVPEFHNDNFKSAIILALEYGLIEQGGAWYYFDKGTENEIKFQGLDKVIVYLRDKPEIVEEFKEKILEIERNKK